MPFCIARESLGELYIVWVYGVSGLYKKENLGRFWAYIKKQKIEVSSHYKKGQYQQRDKK